MKIIYEAPEIFGSIYRDIVLADNVSLVIDPDKNPDVDYGDDMWG